jgi:hypothetical protein
VFRCGATEKKENSVREHEGVPLQFSGFYVRLIRIKVYRAAEPLPEYTGPAGRRKFLGAFRSGADENKWINELFADTMNIKPIQPKRISDQVFEQIRELIYKGVFKPGQQIPAERELADLHGRQPHLRP